MEILENKSNMIILQKDDNTEFYSYNSLIAIFCGKELVLTKKWNYSQTTLKQLKYFINNYTCFNYETKKQFIEEIKKYNIKII